MLVREKNGKNAMRTWVVTYTITRHQTVTARDRAQAESKVKRDASALREIIIIDVEEA